MEQHRATAAQLQPLLGKYIRVKITRPMGAPLREGTSYGANYGEMTGHSPVGCKPDGVFILGIHHPVRYFDGRVIALAFCKKGSCYAIAAPKHHRYIVGQIRRALRFAFPGGCYELQCLYERSCGAVVFRKTDSGLRFLLIKNRRSANWGFPKGHVENFESAEQTAKREVLEETGLRIRLMPGFACHAEYTIRAASKKA